MKCTKCNQELRVESQKISENATTISFQKTGYCDTCMFKFNLGYYEMNKPTVSFQNSSTNNNIFNPVSIEQPKTKKKDSLGSIIAALLSLFTFTYIIGFIVAIMDLLLNDKTKRHLGSWFAIIMSAILFIVGNANNDSEPKNETTKFYSSVESAEDNSSKQTEQTPTAKTETTVDDIEVIKEYTIADGFAYTYHFVIVKNNGDIPVSISTSTLAYKSDGSLISVADSGIDVLGSGSTSIYYDAFETKDEISRYEIDLSIDKDVWYECGLNNLSYKQNDIKNGVIFQVKNNGDKPVSFVQGFALFFKDGKLVNWEFNYFTDNDYEIKSDSTISKQFDCYKDYDTVEFYLTGRISKH